MTALHAQPEAFEPISGLHDPAPAAASELKRVAEILVIDDDGLFRMYTRALLEREGYAIEVAVDGDDGRRLLRERQFDLVICDYHMPGLNGSELFASERGRAPFVFTTSSESAEHEVECLRLGALDYLRKPLRDQVFLFRVQRALEKARQQGSGSVVVPAAAQPDPDSTPTVYEPPPSRRAVGDFVIERVLGRGGMGTVYLANQRSLARPVALKVLNESFDADEEVGMRFWSEARTVAALDHPNIVRVYAVGTDAEKGTPFFAMEFLDGCTLAQLMRNRPPSLRTCIDICIAVARGLEAAWKQGLVHRDIKPGNIMLSEDGLIKILDFGVAKRTDAETQVTRTGTMIGTVEYMSPEQANGRPVDCRADLYSLGVVLYEMLAGAKPFEATDVASLLYLHGWVPPRKVGAYRREVPAELDEVIQRLMAKQRHDRFARPAELIEVLELLKRKLVRKKVIDVTPGGPAVPPLRFDESQQLVAPDPGSGVRSLLRWSLLLAVVFGLGWAVWWALG